mmetsp:Transcript_57539/g.166520  ORF Transcript_57539/g.166520 Transcript_57539/m.166520 type:complete len:257 (-) Transcript_57539:23-793(-)
MRCPAPADAAAAPSAAALPRPVVPAGRRGLKFTKRKGATRSRAGSGRARPRAISSRPPTRRSPSRRQPWRPWLGTGSCPCPSATRAAPSRTTGMSLRTATAPGRSSSCMWRSTPRRSSRCWCAGAAGEWICRSRRSGAWCGKRTAKRTSNGFGPLAAFALRASRLARAARTLATTMASPWPVGSLASLASRARGATQASRRCERRRAWARRGGSRKRQRLGVGVSDPQEVGSASIAVGGAASARPLIFVTLRLALQ